MEQADAYSLKFKALELLGQVLHGPFIQGDENLTGRANCSRIPNVKGSSTGDPGSSKLRSNRSLSTLAWRPRERRWRNPAVVTSADAPSSAFENHVGRQRRPVHDTGNRARIHATLDDDLSGGADGRSCRVTRRRQTLDGTAESPTVRQHHVGKRPTDIDSHSTVTGLAVRHPNLPQYSASREA